MTIIDSFAALKKFLGRKKAVWPASPSKRYPPCTYFLVYCDPLFLETACSTKPNIYGDKRIGVMDPLPKLQLTLQL